jgi:hypothetical protein
MWVVCGNDRSVMNGHFVEETFISWRAEAEIATIVLLGRLAKDVC